MEGGEGVIMAGHRSRLIVVTTDWLARRGVSSRRVSNETLFLHNVTEVYIRTLETKTAYTYTVR